MENKNGITVFDTSLFIQMLVDIGISLDDDGVGGHGCWDYHTPFPTTYLVQSNLFSKDLQIGIDIIRFH